MKNTLRKSVISLAIITSLGLSGCFDGAASSPTLETTSLNKTSTGVITGFGSVFINGVEYETDNSVVTLDGVENAVGHDAGLKLGMVVTVSGDASGAVGNAASIEFNDEIEGMVTEVPVTDGSGVTSGALKIMGVTVNVDDDTVFDSSDATIAAVTDLALGHIVEVSGYSAGDGTVWATRIELKKLAREVDDKVEVQGKITNFDATTNTFTIGDMTVVVSADVLATLEADGISLADGMLVDAKSNVALNADGSLELTEIEVKNTGKKKFEFDADDDEVEVEGVVTATATAGVFEVNGASVTFDANTRFVHGTETTISLGLKLKVKGSVDTDGNFVAKTIVFKPTGDIKMSGPITSANATDNSVNMFGLTVLLVNDTFVEDDRDVAEEMRVKYLFGADDLTAGDWLKIKAYKNSKGELIATKMIRKTVNSGKSAKLQGKIEALTPDTLVSGVKVDVSSVSSLSSPAVGDRLELKGSFDETLNTFIATDGETASMEGPYIGGEDAEENMEEGADKDMATDSDADKDMNADNDSDSSNTMNM